MLRAFSFSTLALATFFAMSAQANSKAVSCNSGPQKLQGLSGFNQSLNGNLYLKSSCGFEIHGRDKNQKPIRILAQTSDHGSFGNRKKLCVVFTDDTGKEQTTCGGNGITKECRKLPKLDIYNSDGQLAGRIESKAGCLTDQIVILPVKNGKIIRDTAVRLPGGGMSKIRPQSVGLSIQLEQNGNSAVDELAISSLPNKSEMTINDRKLCARSGKAEGSSPSPFDFSAGDSFNTTVCGGLVYNKLESRPGTRASTNFAQPIAK